MAGNFQRVKLLRPGYFTACLAILSLVIAVGAHQNLYATAEKAGSITDFSGTARAVSASGDQRTLDEDSAIYQGDKIITEDETALTMTFMDETHFELGANAQIVIDEFIYSPKSTEGSMALNVLKGGFRFVSGKVAKLGNDKMKVGLPVGFIGIRGTDVVAKASASSAEILLQEPEDGHASAILVANKHGSVIVDKFGYGTEIPDANSAPTPPRRWAQQRVNSISRSIRSMGTRMRPPRMR